MYFILADERILSTTRTTQPPPPQTATITIFFVLPTARVGCCFTRARI